MRVFVAGATGFIGAALVEGLSRRGHSIVAGVHAGSDALLSDGVESIAIDFMQDLAPTDWVGRLRGIDVVVNAVGILRESASETFENIHHRAPRALFEACDRLQIKQVIQVSALGADEQAISRYHLSKKAADDFLRTTQLSWHIVQPSLVFGARSASTDLFLKLCSLPLIPLVGRGEQRVQPIHIDDLVELMVRLVEEHPESRSVVKAVGPEPVSFRDMLTSYRTALGFGTGRMIPVPVSLVSIAAKTGDCIAHSALSTETLHMLLRENVASVEETQRVLGRSPRKLKRFTANEHIAFWRDRVLGFWVKQLVIGAVAIMWIAAGLVSWFFAREMSLDLLARLGLGQGASLIALVVSCSLNVLLGLLTLVRPGRLLWITQLLTMLFYTLALTAVAPSLWLDPFGPLVKNLPLAALLIALLMGEKRHGLRIG